MGIINFAKKMARVDFKNSILYIVSIVITTAFMLNAINISYNKYIYPSNIAVEKVDPNLIANSNGNLEFFDTRPILFQKQNIFILLMIVIIFSAFCNLYYIKRKKKEIAFNLINGASLIDITKYLLYINGVNYLIGTLIGLIIGIILIPAFNLLMYSLTGTDGNIINFSIDAIGITLAFIFIQFVALVGLNFGSSYRYEIIDLIKVEKTISFKDNRAVKVPGVFFLVLYIIPILYGLFSKGSQGDDIAIYYLGILGLFGMLGTINYFMPKLISKLKKREFMYKSTRRIYISNFMCSLQSAKLYFLGIGFSLIYFANTIERYSYRPGVIQNGVFCFIGSSLVIGLTLAYKLSVEAEEKKDLYRQLKILGYTREEISNIINKEYILFFGIGLLMPLLIIFVTLFTYIKLGGFTLNFAIGIFACCTIPLGLSGIITTKLNKEKILKWVYGGI